MNGSVPLGRIFGVPLRIHWSAPLLVFLLSSALSGRTLPAWAPGQSATVYTVSGLVGAMLLLVSLVLHEAAHAVTARRAGIDVEDITVWGLGGITRIGRASTPRVQFAVSMVGPLTSLALGGLSIAAAFGARDVLHWAVPSAVLFWTGWTNLLLGVFNLLPAAPLDGGRVLQSAIWWRGGDRERAERIAGRTGQVVGALMVAAGWAELSYGGSAGLWLMFIGLFVSVSALAEVRRAVLVAALRGLRVADVMSAPVVTAPEWLSVDRFLEEIVTWTHHSVIPLLDIDGRPSGIVDRRRLATLPPSRRAEVRLRDLAVPIGPGAITAPGDQLVDVLDHAGVAVPLRLLVLEGDRLVGIVTGHDIARIAQQRLPAPGSPERHPSG
ncbi:site-2 protease family protein [Kitasatospora sp. P5_F3]